MSTDKQNTDNELAMAILNGLSGPNACKSENEALRRELADAQENYHLVNEMVARLRNELFNVTCKGAAMAGYLQAIADSTDMMPDQGELQRLLKKSINDWDSAVETAGWKGSKR